MAWLQLGRAAAGAAAAAAFLLVSACGGDDDPPGQTDCPPGTAAAVDGSCVASELPFDRRGCQGRFPVAEDAPNTRFVEAGAAAAGADGSAAHPYPTIQAGVDAAPPGGTVAIAAGDYAAGFVVAKPLTVEARCARDVIVRGAIEITSSDVAVRGLQVTGVSPAAITVTDAGGGAGVELRWLLVDVNQGAGVHVLRSRFALRDSQVSHTTAVAGGLVLGQEGAGVWMADGSDGTIDLSTINMNDRGVYVADATGTVGAAQLTTASVATINMNDIIDNGGDGVAMRREAWVGPAAAGEPELVITASTIRGNGGFGVAATATRVEVATTTLENNAASRVEPAQLLVSGGTLSLTGSTLGPSPSYGVYLQDTPATLSMNTIRQQRELGLIAYTSTVDAEENRFEENGTGGLVVIGGPGSTISANVLEDNAHGGITVVGSDGSVISMNEVSGTTIDPMRDAYSSGSGIYVDDTAVLVVDNVVSGTEGIGIGWRCNLGSTVQVGISNNSVTGAGVAGITVEGCEAGGAIGGNVIMAARGYGIRVLDPSNQQFTIDGNMVLSTMSRGGGNDGDGILLENSSALIQNNTVDGSARLGILASGSLCAGVVSGNTVGISMADIIFQNTTAIGDGGNTADPAQTVPSGTYPIDTTPSSHPEVGT